MVIISIEGIDGSGKSTQLDLLRITLDNKDDVTFLSFPDKLTTTGIVINKYLHNELPLSDEEITTLFKLNFMEKKEFIKSFVNSKKILIIERYIDSWYAYSKAKKINQEIEMPEPDLVIFLNINPSISLERIIKKDKYEKDDKYMMKVYDSFLCELKRKNTIYFDDTFSKDELHKCIVSVVKDFL
jgi:dTMP kinase